MDAFGYNALSGFFGSAGIKDVRMQELQYLEKIYNLRKMKQQEEEQRAKESQQLIDTAYSTAVELTTGKNTRRKDILDIESISSELLAPINDKIRQAGSYEKAKRLGIDKDLRDYQYKLMNNDKVYQMKLNQNAIAKIIEADASGKGHLINEADRRSFEAWKAEKSDKVTYRGTPDSELNTDFINSADYAGRNITKQDYLAFNKEALIADWAYSVSDGDPQKEQEAHLLAQQNPNIINAGGWFDRKLQILQGVRDENGKLLYDPNIKFGTGVIKTSLSEELLKGQLQMFPEDGLRLSQIIENGGFTNLFKNANISNFFETTFGIDEDNPGLIEKDSYILDSAGRLAGNDPALERRLVFAGLDNGPDAQQDYYVNRNGDIMLKINNINIQKMYDYKGLSLDGETSFMDRTADDMKFGGIFLGMKVTYTNEAGELKSKLLTKGVKDIDFTDSAENINKTLLGEAYDPRYKDIEYRPAYVMQFEEPDLFGFETKDPLSGGRMATYSDIYYREINLGNNNTLAALKDEAYDEQLTNAKNERFNAQRYQSENRERNKTTLQTRTQLDDIYASGSELGIQELTANHEPYVIYTSRAMGFDRRMDPYIMADVFDMAQMQGGGNFSQNVQLVLNNFHKLEEKSPELLRVYKSGNPKALIDHYKSTMNESEFKQKLARFKLWSKYFNPSK